MYTFIWWHSRFRKIGMQNIVIVHEHTTTFGLTFALLVILRKNISSNHLKTFSLIKRFTFISILISNSAFYNFPV